jgi:hypothetical protein
MCCCSVFDDGFLFVTALQGMKMKMGILSIGPRKQQTEEEDS